MMLLILDGNYLVHRAAYSRGHLSYNGEPTGVLFGFFSDLFTLMENFACQRVVFCFDSGPGLREERCPSYKAKRRKIVDTSDPMLKQKYLAKLDLAAHITSLRTEWLPEAGFKNCYMQKGYEADDIIASVVKCLPSDQQATMVSADKDLYQLIQPNVTQYDPRLKRSMTEGSFFRKYGIFPSSWPIVKAIGGCVSDEVHGVKGVGEATAIKYITNTLKPTSNAYRNIVKWQKLWEMNLPLVTLPYPGVRDFIYQKDKLCKAPLRRLFQKYGIARLMEYVT